MKAHTNDHAGKESEKDFRRLLNWALGFVIILAVVGWQVSQFQWDPDAWWNFEPGKHRLNSLRNLLTILADVVVLTVWSIWRPHRLEWALAVGALLLVAWGLTPFVAVLVSAIMHGVT